MWGRILMLWGSVALARGHGRVLEPPGRASVWRFGYDSLPNYDDDGLNCGGFSHQWSVNNGRCGICGDPYGMAQPRHHELGGKYGNGYIVAKYASGQAFNATIDLTVYHRGYWVFKICPDPERVDQACFDEYEVELEAGGSRYYPREGSKVYQVPYRLPAGLACAHCVLQWRYTAGNNWGVCSDGSQALGCGHQETFGACSDIAIYANSQSASHHSQNGYSDLGGNIINLLRPSIKPRPTKIERYKDKFRKRRKWKNKKKPKSNKKKG